MSVKNGAELLDRQLKDIVQDQAALYISRANFGDDYQPEVPPDGQPSGLGLEKDPSASTRPQPQRAFSLPRFIPLLHERLSVLNPFTRTFLISWLLTLDQVPDLELITFLPDFLDGLLRYLGDPTDEVRCSTESLLEDLLREIRDARKHHLEGIAARREAWERELERARRRRVSEARTVTVADHTEGGGDDGADEGADGKGTPTPRTLGDEEGAEDGHHDDDDDDDALADSEDEDGYPLDGDGSAEWLPGQGVHIEYGAIVEILVHHLGFPGASHPSFLQMPSCHWQLTLLVPHVQTKRSRRRACIGSPSSSRSCRASSSPLRRASSPSSSLPSRTTSTRSNRPRATPTTSSLPSCRPSPSTRPPPLRRARRGQARSRPARRQTSPRHTRRPSRSRRRRRRRRRRSRSLRLRRLRRPDRGTTATSPAATRRHSSRRRRLLSCLSLPRPTLDTPYPRPPHTITSRRVSASPSQTTSRTLTNLTRRGSRTARRSTS